MTSDPEARAGRLGPLILLAALGAGLVAWAGGELGHVQLRPRPELRPASVQGQAAGSTYEKTIFRQSIANRSGMSTGLLGAGLGGALGRWAGGGDGRTARRARVPVRFDEPAGVGPCADTGPRRLAPRAPGRGVRWPDGGS